MDTSKLSDSNELSNAHIYYDAGVRYVYSERNSHYYTDLNQIIESLKYIETFGYDHLIIGVQNSINLGYEIMDKSGEVGIYILETLKHNLKEEKSAVQLTKMLKYLLKNNCNIMESEPVR